jgi:hypothetical protein
LDELRRPLGVALLTLLLTGCGATPQPAWSHSFESADALATEVLDALAAADEPRLARLALSEDELRNTVWPLLPASRGDVGMPWNYFWREHAQRNAGYLKTLLTKHGGKGYNLAAVSFDGHTTYGDVIIHRDPALDLRTAAGPQRLRLFGSMAERGGRWKLYSFVVD